MIHLRIATLLIFILLLSQTLYGGSFEILKEEPMPNGVFTQGFEINDNVFYFSSGGYGASFIHVSTVEGKPLSQKKLSKRFFSEGLTIKDDKLYVLTWKRGILLVFDKNTLELLDAKHYKGEGWGLTHDNNHFILSNGSHVLQFKDLNFFKTERELQVKNGDRKLQNLNELEYAENKIWANVWKDDHVFAIDPESGAVIGKWNLAPISKSLNLTNPEAVLNGIAYDPNQQAFWITGKLWPKRFLVRFNFD